MTVESDETATTTQPPAKPASETTQPSGDKPGEKGNGAAPDSAPPENVDFSEKQQKQIGYIVRKALKGLTEAEEEFREQGIEIRDRNQRKQMLESLATKETKETESEQRVRALEKRAREAEEAAKVAQERADGGELQAFALKAMGDVFHRGAALAVLGLNYVPKERLAKRDGKIVVVDDEGIVTHHDPTQWVQARLDSKELDFLRPGRTAVTARNAVNAATQRQEKQQPEAQRPFRDIGDRKRAAVDLLKAKFGG